MRFLAYPVALVFYCVLFGMKLCPHWFLGLFISITMIQGLGYFLIRSHGYGGNPPAPLAGARLNVAVQFTWIFVVAADLFLRSQFPRNFHYSHDFHMTGYLVAAIFQFLTLFRNFFHYRLFRLVDFSTARA